MLHRLVARSVSATAKSQSDRLFLCCRPLSIADDELHNLNLTENAKHAAALDLKKKGRQAGQYQGYDDDEFGQDGAMGSKRGVLSKYDEGFEGVKEDGFRLGSEAESTKKVKSTTEGGASGVESTGERERVKLSMDYTSKSLRSNRT